MYAGDPHSIPLTGDLDAVAVAGIAQLRQAEVAHLHEVARLAVIVRVGDDHHVLRLDVAMDDALRMGEDERAADLDADVDDAPRRHRPLGGEDRLERASG